MPVGAGGSNERITKAKGDPVVKLAALTIRQGRIQMNSVEFSCTRKSFQVVWRNDLGRVVDEIEVGLPRRKPYRAVYPLIDSCSPIPPWWRSDNTNEIADGLVAAISSIDCDENL